MKLRFSIREMLLLVVIAALAIGWYLDHRRLTSYELNFTISGFSETNKNNSLAP